jgi:hypothetical protein
MGIPSSSGEGDATTGTEGDTTIRSTKATAEND